MSSGKVVLGLLAGIAAGAVLGILLAPEKGSDTRKKISNKGKDYSDSLKDKFTEFKDSINKKFDKVKDDVDGFAEQVQATTEKVKKDIKSAQN